MPTLADPATRASLVTRIARLTPDRTPRWGRMNAPQMLAHCSDAMRMAYGEVVCEPKRVPIVQLGIVKWLVLNVLPFPKSAPTAPELLSRSPAPWDEERAQLAALVQRFGDESKRASWPQHPLFGTLTGAQWGQLGWKHLDHHLGQFGV
ncbi:MAG TPA: DinB family protein [Gemmatimonas aurantiaca]|uniref:DUF1569 domain-containing protein n=2 Tax=Gemmatimonas aurantiaca TaxID=173480 RepID=C1ACV8_GEMAT|nr:DUF1569 domain-containing protein [Gemmatimonas aurantiaca]BAH40335.1 hypothetical protein GAU_3293 [Gemmatimonas aurantiaca T-27]HCT57655.1 DinB family protein [Gemmatimonas aurantiaca]